MNFDPLNISTLNTSFNFAENLTDNEEATLNLNTSSNLDASMINGGFTEEIFDDLDELETSDLLKDSTSKKKIKDVDEIGMELFNQTSSQFEQLDSSILLNPVVSRKKKKDSRGRTGIKCTRSDSSVKYDG